MLRQSSLLFILLIALQSQAVQSISDVFTSGYSNHFVITETDFQAEKFQRLLNQTNEDESLAFGVYVPNLDCIYMVHELKEYDQSGEGAVSRWCRESGDNHWIRKEVIKLIILRIYV